jgi:hypothetical protein
MLASISPLGERARHQSYPVTVAAYLAASTAAGAGLGAALGALGGAAPGFDWRLAVGALGLGGLALDARALGTRVPGPRRQVNEDWLATYRGWVYGAGFGAQLGGAFTTIVSSSLTWSAFACALVAGTPAAGALVGATFGAARALPILTTARVRDPQALRNVLRRVDRLRAPARRTAMAVQAAIAIALLAAYTGSVR